jgi:pilus assembly protein CpaF
MVAMANLNLPERAVRQQIVAALTLVVQISRLSDGSRRVVNVAEITGMESDMISMQDIFTFVRRGIGPSGRVSGMFRPTGIRPKFMDRLRVAGIVLPLEIFEKTLDVG